MTKQMDQIIADQAKNAPAKYDDLTALFLVCTLERTPRLSHTETLVKNVAQKVFEANGVKTKIIRPVDYTIAAGLGLDMSKTPEWDVDEWPQIQKEIDAADIVIICTSVWLGEKTSVTNLVFERMYGYTHKYNEKGQYRDYGKVGGTIITGNEDGVKHCAMNILFSLSHIGFTVPPQVDAGWMGEAGPGPSYADEGSGGEENEFTNRNSSILAWNCMHTARMLKDQGGVSSHGTQPDAYKTAANPENPNPEHQ